MSELLTEDKTEQKKYIVLIDDDESSLHLICWMFIEKGESVAGFTTGTAALEFIRLRSSRIKCVITDLSLPTQDGLTIVEQLRFNEQTFDKEPVPVAFLTGWHQPVGGATERVAAKCNVDRIWHKPEDTPEIYEKVTEWLAEKQCQKAECQEAQKKENYANAL